MNIIDIVILVDIVLHPEYLGCTDPIASNYNPDAFYDDGSCDYSNIVIDIDGNIYNIVIVGEQIWMQENLKVTHYRNGDEILTEFTSYEWSHLDDTETGAYTIYPWDSDNASQTTCAGNCVEVYGILYNWYAVDDDRGICPEGWHVPTFDEANQFYNFLGNYIGGRLKATGTIEIGDGLWYHPNTGATNEIEFTALPAGNRNVDYEGLGYQYTFWSSTEYINNSDWAYSKRLYHDSSQSGQGAGSKNFGFSIRCVRD